MILDGGSRNDDIGIMNNINFEITVFRDDDTGVWIARNEDIPLVSEAASYEALVARVWDIAPEIIVLNGHAEDDAGIRLRFVNDTEAGTMRAVS